MTPFLLIGVQSLGLKKHLPAPEACCWKMEDPQFVCSLHRLQHSSLVAAAASPAPPPDPPLQSVSGT